MTMDQPETYNVVKSWINSFKDFGARNNKHIFNVYEGFVSMQFVMSLLL